LGKFHKQAALASVNPPNDSIADDLQRCRSQMDKLEIARDQCASGEVLQAQLTLEAALREGSDDPSVRLAYAAVLLQEGDWQRGLDQLQVLRASGCWQPVVEAYAGGALLGLNRTTDAKDILDAAYARDPHNIYILLKRGELYCRLGIYSVAVDTLQQAQKVACEDARMREAVRRLLRFARKQDASGFVRNVPRPLGWPTVAGLRRLMAAVLLVRPLRTAREQN
jgi:tetratricopeptide (TPR) repeat protein